MHRSHLFAIFLFTACFGQQVPHNLPDGFALPNGWTITPAGKAIPAEDMVLNLSLAPDGKSVIALQGGYNDEGLLLIDTATEATAQQIVLPTVWLGLAWSPDGKRLFVSGGNGTGSRPQPAPIRVFAYTGGKLSETRVLDMNESINPDQVYWAGLAHHPSKALLYAANRGTGAARGTIVVFDSDTGKLIGRIPVEVNPYTVVISVDGRTLYASNWASASVSVVDTATMRNTATIRVDRNPNDMVLAPDGRLFVACSNDNTVVVIDTKTRMIRERIATALFPHAPPGSTPNALAHDAANRMLFVANADNNDVAVVNVSENDRSEVLGFIPAGWYPSALAIDAARARLYIGNSKGFGSYPLVKSSVAPSPRGRGRAPNAKDFRQGSVNIVNLSELRARLPEWTRQVYQNTPYRDDLLAAAKPPTAASVIPREVGVGSPIKHVVYIIKENRTYDQVLGDIPQGNGDPSLVLYGRKVTPNHHKIAEQFVLLDNLYSDGETSAEGHSWADASYATDYTTKRWPVIYSGRSHVDLSDAYTPASGFIWDQCARKGLTYRTYGEYGIQVSGGAQISDATGVGNLYGHAAQGYRVPGMRDPENAALFLREFDEFEKNYDNPDAAKRLPNFIIMSLPEDHTRGTTPGAYTPTAMVASNDVAFGQIVERLTHSRYWPEMAVLVVEDDAQDGPDHVDARRTVGFAISPYIRRRKVDSTMYSTASMLRSIELLLGLPPMTQYDAAAMPMYNAFGDTPDLTPYDKLPAEVDLNVKNTARAYGARESQKMDFDDVDRAPMYALNEILWKDIKGARSPMPAPVHRYQLSGAVYDSAR
jgi:YVTN family beta-propeller protein